MNQTVPHKEQGVALVITLIVLAVMAVVAVAFMQGAGTDRSASNSLVANYQARLAAEAGAQCAAGTLRRVICFGGNSTSTNSANGYHDAITVWQNIGGAFTNEATVLYVRAKATNTEQGARPGEFGGDIRLLARPLVSGGTFAPVEEIGTNMPFNTSDTNLMREMVNLNATNDLNTNPWIGLRSTPVAEAPVTAARWIYISRDGGPTNINNPPIARYAYWAEDESFKVNVNVVTAGLRGTNAGTGPSEASIDGPLAASPLLTSLVGGTATMLQDRARFGVGGFPSSGAAALALDVQGTTKASAWRFLTTTHSAGLDLARGGFKRFNINTVTNGIAGPADAANIRTSLNRVIAAITNSNSVPNFGQRFYRLTNTVEGINATNAVTSEHANIYLQKIAANILDYVDDDDVPTIVSSAPGFPIHPQGQAPEYGIEAQGGGNSGPPVLYTGATNFVPLAAVGVENVPRLQEFVIHGRVQNMSPVGLQNSQTNNPPGASFSVTIDYYLEFWNPGTRDFVVGPGAFIKLYSIPPFDLGGVEHELTDPARTVRIDLPDGFTFPAGAVTVITTDPNPNTDLTQGRPVRSLPILQGQRSFTGTTRAFSTTSTAGWESNFPNTYQVRFRGRESEGLGSSLTDYGMVMLFGDSTGFLDSSIGLPVAGSGNVFSLDWNRPEKRDTPNQYFVRGGSLRGNSTSGLGPTSTEGDPRTLNEQLGMRIYVNDGESNFEQTRFFTTLTDTNVPGTNSSIGLPNANFVRPTNWVDFSSISPGAANAPLFLRNRAMQSIGELGHITDPARVPGRTGGLTSIIHSRGGGRTLRVGQPELRAVDGTAATARPGWFDGNQTSASRTWTSWRLADVFTTTAALSVPGQINPNGVLRDNGAALRAALHGMRMLPSPDGAANTSNRLVNVTNVVTAMLERMTNLAGSGLPDGSLNALWERGEISELPLLGSGNQLLQPSGVLMQQAFDRGREELVRRSVEMITTRGSVFTVYVVGQALQVTPQTTNVIGSARLKQTFEISPQYAGGTNAFNDAFNPASNLQLQARFRAPTNYTLRVLATSYD
jgi:hypothetical protein